MPVSTAPGQVGWEMNFKLEMDVRVHDCVSVRRDAFELCALVCVPGWPRSPNQA